MILKYFPKRKYAGSFSKEWNKHCNICLALTTCLVGKEEYAADMLHRKSQLFPFTKQKDTQDCQIGFTCNKSVFLAKHCYKEINEYK